MRTIAAIALLALVSIAISGCSTTPNFTKQYNSLDLALLPCEQGDAPTFFRPIEFDSRGELLFPEQLAEVNRRLAAPLDDAADPPIGDLVIFIHGWNKNPSSAEEDYDDFLCRLHARLQITIGKYKRNQGLMIVGIFWPSTLTAEDRDPLLIKPVSYFPMRERADTIAGKGLAPLFESWIPIFQKLAVEQKAPRLQLIGHSFGARMLVRTMETLEHRGKDELNDLLQSAQLVDVVLLNAALAPARFDWLTKAVLRAEAAKKKARFVDTNSYLFNVHSYEDQANRTLFPIASMFDDDPVQCAAGACGVPSYPTLCVNHRGHIERPPDAYFDPDTPRLKAWNVDATRVVSGHGDIYKGRIATLVATLMYDEDKKSKFAAWGIANRPSEQRCDWAT